MEGRDHSPSLDKQPLVSQPQQRPLSGEQSEHVEASQSQHPEPSQGPTSPYYPVAPYTDPVAPYTGAPYAGAPYAGPFSPHQQEADIADHRPSGFLTRDMHESASVQEAHLLDYIVPRAVRKCGPNRAPIKPKFVPGQGTTVWDRLKDTLEAAETEQLKYAKRAKWAGYAVNGAMFAQIIVNALVTGLSAAPSSRSAQIGVSAMGAIGTILASFLVRVRGTQEPERSVTHSQNLEKFVRELKAFLTDEGNSDGRHWVQNVKDFREEFNKLETAMHQSENGQPMSAAPASTMGDIKPKKGVTEQRNTSQV